MACLELASLSRHWASTFSRHQALLRTPSGVMWAPKPGSAVSFRAHVNKLYILSLTLHDLRQHMQVSVRDSFQAEVVKRMPTHTSAHQEPGNVASRKQTGVCWFSPDTLLPQDALFMILPSSLEL